MILCQVKRCPHPAIQGSRYCASHAPFHGTCPECGLHYTSMVDRAYIADYGVCMFCAGKREAIQDYMKRKAVRGGAA